MPYKGTVRGKVIELESDVPLPDGTEVEIVVKDHEKKTVTASGHPRSSPQAILKFLDTPPLCTSDDVEALLKPSGRQSGLWVSKASSIKTKSS